MTTYFILYRERGNVVELDFRSQKTAIQFAKKANKKFNTKVVVVRKTKFTETPIWKITKKGKLVRLRR